MDTCRPSQDTDGSRYSRIDRFCPAFADEAFNIIPALLCALFACGMQIAANFINDLYDYLKGSDRADRLGPERACAQGWILPQP